jgi:hypothetical protein
MLMDLAKDSLAEARQRLFRQFADDVRRLLGEDTTAVGQLTYTHISRQLDLAASDRYTRWFQEVGESFGFDQGVTLAAVAGSDVTRMSMFSETSRANFGTTEERVRALAARGGLLYGRVFETYTALENLYMHSEGGRHYTQTELARRSAAILGSFEAEKAAREVAESLVGHDSFNAGFGQHKLKALLAAKYGEPVEAFDYATARSPSGFLVQVLDRLEGCEPETMLRYVTEGVLQRKESISQAIRTGLIDNAAYLAEVRERIVQDARQVLTAEQVRVLLDFPGMQDYTRKVKNLPQMLSLLGTPLAPDTDGFYYLAYGGDRIRLDSLDVFREHFLSAVERL